MNAAIKFKKSNAIKSGLYWFQGPNGMSCVVARQGERWFAKGIAWYGPVVRYGSTRQEAARKLINEMT